MITNSAAVGYHWQGVHKVDGRVYMFAHNYVNSGSGVHKWDWSRKNLSTTS